LPTVTLTVDATTGLIAAPGCPSKVRMTYPSGEEPRQVCTAHPTVAPPQAAAQRADDARAKSFAKRLLSPSKWFSRKDRPAGTQTPAAPPPDGRAPEH
jgi:hypothetical protein